MDKKIIAVAVVAVLIVAAVGVFFATNNSDNEDNSDSMKIVGRVNTDGSGIYFKEGYDVNDYVKKVSTKPTSGAYLGGSAGWIVFDASNWGGKVIGDPGEATIQHVQLGQIAEVMGLKFVKYTIGTQVSKDTLYYLPGVANYANFKSTIVNTPALIGAFNWEPQCSLAVMDGCSMVATTNEMFPGHTCCIIGASNNYISAHEDETVRFLAAYIESVNQMTAAINAGSGDAYEELIKIAMSKVAMAGTDEAQKREAIESAFGLVVYKYADTTNPAVADPLADLKKDIASLADSFYPSLVDKSYSDLGFSSASALADAFVDSSYIKKAMNYSGENTEKFKIKVSVITGDIHQLAIHYGMEKKIFDKYGVEVTTVGQANGPAVYTSLHTGDAQFGFIGAPPMTINSMNAGEIKA